MPVHALRNITRLGVQQDVDASRLPVEAILLVGIWPRSPLRGRGTDTWTGSSVGSPRLSDQDVAVLVLFNSVCGRAPRTAITKRFVRRQRSQGDTEILEASVAETAA